MFYFLAEYLCYDIVVKKVYDVSFITKAVIHNNNNLINT